MQFFLFPYDRLLAVESEPLHEKDQGQNENHEAAQDQEGVVEGKHVRLPHEAAIHEARRQGEGALLLQRRRQNRGGTTGRPGRRQ